MNEVLQTIAENVNLPELPDVVFNPELNLGIINFN